MIYLVSENQFDFNTDIIKQVSVEESLSILAPLKIVGLDTETSKLDPHTGKLLLVQLGCKDFQVVIDCRTIDILLYKEYLESDRLFLGWNIKFDLQWFFNFGIIIKKVWDGFLAEKLIWLGYPAGMHSMALAAAAESYIGVYLDKSVRGKIIWSPILTEDIVVYGADDVKYLEDIKNKQDEELDKQELQTALDLENCFVIVMAYIEWCGVKVDIEKWKYKMSLDEKAMEEAMEKCNKWLIENEPNSSYVFVDYQGDLFSGFNTEPQVSINWKSVKQVAPIFEKYGVNIIDPKEGKKTLEAKILRPQANKCSLIPLYIEFKEAAQQCQTFGSKFIDQINPVTNRLHANWNSIGTDTARVSCGDGGDDSINLLNLPADKLTRSCFISEPNNQFISIDYSGQESMLLASIANDPLMLKEINEGSGDIHSLVASLMFEELKDVPLKDIKKLYKPLRQEAKLYEFLIAYGGDFNTMMTNFGLEKEDAKIKYDRYMGGLSGVKKYQEFRRKDWYDKGYILLNPFTKYRAHIYDYALLRGLESKLTYDFYAMAKSYKKQENKELETKHKPAISYIVKSFVDGVKPEDLVGDYTYSITKSKKKVYITTFITLADAYRYPIKYFFKRKAASEKQSINYPIQHPGACCSKTALVKFFRWIVANNLFGKVLITIIPYDEVNCEAPKRIAEEVAAKLHSCMVEAGAFFCTRCKLDADISRLEDGSLPTYWIH